MSIEAALPQYEVFAIKYAWRDALRSNHFIGGDAHDGPMPMDYFIWLIQGNGATWVLDTGFTAEVAKRRKRQHQRTAVEALALMGVDANRVQNVILSHLHYDHVGGFHFFPQARFHLQEREMFFAVGRQMKFGQFRHSFEPDEIAGMVRLVYDRRVEYCDGSAELAPGITVHHAGGHTDGVQFVRVHTRRGWVVLAADVTHYYENMEKYRPFTTCFHIGDALAAFDKLRAAAPGMKHIIPGHDPLVMKRYPAPGKELEGIVVRLDVDPTE